MSGDLMRGYVMQKQACAPWFDHLVYVCEREGGV